MDPRIRGDDGNERFYPFYERVNFVGMGAAMDGDVNGDGFNDLLADIGGDVAELGTTVPTVALFYMPLQGIHTILEHSFSGGDIDSDGYDDLVIRTEGTDQVSRVYILQGGPVELKR